MTVCAARGATRSEHPVAGSQSRRSCLRLVFARELPLRYQMNLQSGCGEIQALPGYQHRASAGESNSQAYETSCVLLRELQKCRNRGGMLLPVLHFVRETLYALRCQPVITGAAIVFAPFPLGFDEARRFHSAQSRIQRSLFDSELPIRRSKDVTGYAVPMLGAAG